VLPQRTVIVYMIADNNLDYFAQNDLNEMEQGWQATLNGNLVVYVDRADGASPAHPVVYHITHDTTQTITSPIVWVYKEQNSTDADIMRQVLSDIIAEYPAQSYGLVLWSHGTGWLPQGASTGTKPDAALQRTFGRDGTEEMNIRDLNNALSRKFDFILFDACYMGTVEVVYELRNKADYIIASPTEVLSAGYPYQNIVPDLFSKTIDYRSVANAFFQSYATLDGAVQSATVAVINTAALDNLAQCFGIIMSDTAQLMCVESDALQQFSTTQNGLMFDIGDFVSQSGANAVYCNEFLAALAQTVVCKYATTHFLEQLPIDTFSGISVFVPNASNIQYHNFYKNYEWYTASRYGIYFGKFGFGN
jgi:hypothetical protein